MRSSVFYRQFRISGGELLVWLYCEWEDLLPQACLEGYAWGKPVFLCPRRSDWRTTVADKHPARIVNGREWFQNTLRKMGPDDYRIHTDEQMVAEVLGLAEADKGLRRSGVFPLLGIPLGLLQDERGDGDPSLAAVRADREVELAISRTASILGVDEDDVGINGSLLAGLGGKSLSDVDLTVHCELERMPELFAAVLAYKRGRPERQKERYSGLYFPYKIVLDCGTCVDLFPKATNPEAHPLFGTREWRPTGPPTRRLFRISDARYAHEAWPLFYVDDDIRPLLILCNGFRGALTVGDRVEGECFPLELLYLDGRRTEAWAIPDPYNTVADLARFFSSRWHLATN